MVRRCRAFGFWSNALPNKPKTHLHANHVIFGKVTPCHLLAFTQLRVRTALITHTTSDLAVIFMSVKMYGSPLKYGFYYVPNPFPSNAFPLIRSGGLSLYLSLTPPPTPPPPFPPTHTYTYTHTPPLTPGRFGEELR